MQVAILVAVIAVDGGMVSYEELAESCTMESSCKDTKWYDERQFWLVGLSSK